jgi:nucleotide-binding universal stress UspA family protein
MKILIAIDGSSPSTRALNYVLDHVEMFGVNPELHLVNVHLPLPSPRARAWVGDDVVNAYYKDEAEIAFADAKRTLEMRGKGATFHTRIGDPGSELAALANSGFHMLVMGTQGRGALKNFLVGSAANRALAESTVPVLLVK